MPSAGQLITKSHGESLGFDMTPPAKAALSILILVGVCLFALAGCGTTGHVSVMHEFGGDPQTVGQNPLCTFEVKKAVAGIITGKYYHQSWCSSGFPFNDNPESTVDAVGIELQVW